MTDLIFQSIGGPGDLYERWLALTEPVHRAYAETCGADYRLHRGLMDSRTHPAWNRVRLTLEAFDDGYERVVWLDADSLVVDASRDIFAETADQTAPFLMCRTSGFPWPTATGDQEAWNDGVYVAHNGGAARDALIWLWSKRRAPLLGHHVPSLWELSWFLDRLLERPELVAQLDPVFNWQGFEHYPPESDAVICGFHGETHVRRWEMFSAKFAEVYGPVPA